MKQLLVLLFLFCIFLSFPSSTFAAPIVPGSFSVTWDNSGAPGDPNDPVYIGLGSCATSVYWEEIGNPANSSTSFNCVEEGSVVTEVIFPSSGVYRVDYTGTFTTIDLRNAANRAYFRSVEQWGDTAWTSLFGAFQRVTNLAINASDAPDLSLTTDLSYLFAGATNFNSNINHWDVSHVTEMAGMFNGATAYNQPLNNWNVSNVTNFGGGEEGGMFEDAAAYNQPMDTWSINTTASVAMTRMFAGATAFNQPLGMWDVRNVDNFREMFAGATAFDQPLNTWASDGCSNAFNGMNRFFVWEWFMPVTYACASSANLQNMFLDSGLSQENYTTTLIGWSASPGFASFARNLGQVSVNYCDSATVARNLLVDTYGWQIDDLGPVPCEVPNTPSEKGNATKVGVRAERLMELAESTPVVGSMIVFVSSVRDFLTLLTEQEEVIDSLTAEERTRVIVALRDILLFLLQRIPGL